MGGCPASDRSAQCQGSLDPISVECSRLMGDSTPNWAHRAMSSLSRDPKR